MKIAMQRESTLPNTIIILNIHLPPYCKTELKSNVSNINLCPMLLYVLNKDHLNY